MFWESTLLLLLEHRYIVNVFVKFLLYAGSLVVRFLFLIVVVYFDFVIIDGVWVSRFSGIFDAYLVGYFFYDVESVVELFFGMRRRYADSDTALGKRRRWVADAHSGDFFFD